MDRLPDAQPAVQQPEVEPPATGGMRNAMMRLFVAGAMLVIAPNDMLHPPQAIAQERKEDDVQKILKAIPKAELKQLLEFLDEDEFEIREAAQAELLRRVMDGFETSGTMPSWSKALRPVREKDDLVLKDGDTTLVKSLTLEQRSRLDRLRASIGAAQGQTCVKPTMVDMPKGKIKCKDALARMSKSMGRYVELFDPSGKLADEEVDVPSGAFWESAMAIKFKDGSKLWPMATNGEGVEFRASKPDDWKFAAKDGVLGRLRADGTMALYVEPRAEIVQWDVIGVRVNGEHISLANMAPSSPNAFIPLPNDVKGKKVEVTVRMTMVPVRRHDVGPDKEVEIVSGGNTFLFKGVTKKSDEVGNYAAPLELPKSHYGESYKLRATGEDDTGAKLSTNGYASRFDSIAFSFPKKRPSRISLYIPDARRDDVACVADRTLVFDLD